MTNSLRLRFAAMLTVITVGCAMTPTCRGQNFWKRVSNNTETTATTSQQQKSEKKGKKSTSVSALELSLDENLLAPTVAEKDHEAVSRHMKLTAKHLSDRKKERIELMRNAEVVVATLSTDLLFAPNDTTLMAKTSELLQPYTTLLKSGDGQYKLILAVHTDDTGSEAYTDKLSEARVNAIYDVLRRYTTDSELLIPYALGASDPRESNLSRQGRAANRRLEIYVVPTQKLIKNLHSQKD